MSRRRERTLILDEPATGLHFEDGRKLVAVLRQMVEQDNTAIVIEHDPDVIKSADWLIDLGSERGDGGQVMAESPPEMVAGIPGSRTAGFLDETPRIARGR